MLEGDFDHVHGSVLASPKGAAIIVREFGALVRGFGGTDARGTGDLNIRAPGPIWANFNGRLGDVEIGAFGRIDGSRLTMRFELPRAAPEDVRALWPAWPLHEPLRARVEAAGEITDLQTNALLEIGEATVDARGSVRLSGDVGARLEVDAERFDLRSVVSGAPATSFTARTAIDVSRLDEGVVLDVNATTQPASLDGLPVPAVDLLGRYDHRGFSGKATLHEPGLPVKVTFTVDQQGKLEFDARAPLFRVQESPRLASYTDADARAPIRRCKAK